ncbi:histone-lysine N-methyltransferase SUVR5-like [Vicia villosa]|uniref:histone-lysine N-methyltransferase SUVR5-like n=1 Tax=Vicia villosa TaxID=3911 RepID=UPI00273AFD9B|nr:histone-lysine N-methyltransferase SUVR5-like [Vicia villosa]
MDELVCIQNCEPDILLWDNELNGKPLLIMDTPPMQQLSFSERLEIDEPMAVWFKWKGKWHAGIKCARDDLPMSTQKDKPVDDNQNKYFTIFSPDIKNYCWVKMISVQSINEFPQPIAYETHQDGLKIVQDLTIARRFTMQNLLIEMINIVEQIHSHALTEDARDVIVWKRFALEASECKSYSDFGRMVQRLQKSIVQGYIMDDWKLRCSKSWVDRCAKAKNAETIELLTEELVDSILWNDVCTHWIEDPEPKLRYVWKTWKHDVMKWFSRNPLLSSSIGSEPRASSSYGLCQTSFQVGFRRPKLQIRRSMHKSTVEVPVESEFPSQLMKELSDIGVEAVDCDVLPITEMVPRPMDDEERPMDDEEAIELFVEPDIDDTKSRQCEKFIEAKGRQCRGRAIGSDKYCCAHFSRKPAKEDKAPTPMCGGTTMAGTKCKHHSHPGFSFCRKHLSNVETKNRSNLKRRRSKRKAKVYCSGSTSKRRVREDLGVAPPRSPLDIDPVSVIEDDSFIARNILDETLTLSGNDHNEALQWIDSPLNDNDTDNDSSIKCKVCFEEFSDDESLCNHWMENHEREAHWLFMSYACAICLDSFTNKKLLESHVPNRHHVQFIQHCLLLKCNACGGNFGNMDEFWLHVKSIHSSEFKVSKAPMQLTLTHGDDSLEMIEHINEASLEEPQPNNLNILSIACTNSCEVNLEASLMEKYGYLPERLNLRASEDCSEREILENSSRNEIHPVVVSPPSLNLGSLQKAIVLCGDISFGKEPTPVICVLDQEILNSLFEKERYVNLPSPWESFSYVTKQMLDRFPTHNHESLQLRCSCSTSTCCRKTCDHIYLSDNGLDHAKDIFGKPMRGEFPYNKNGQLMLKEGYPVYECNDLCRCSKTCQNRILQKGIQVKLEVFKTKEKGWGVRAGEDILRGTFVCEYIGEVVAKKEVHKRRERYGKNGEYFYDIGAHVSDMSGITEGHASEYVIDSTNYGNVSRFINSSCSPNLVNYQVFIESMNSEHAHIGLYANRDIALGEELTYSYDYEFVGGEEYPCLCGSLKCRN